MIAVLGLFNPALLGITDNNHYVIQEGSKSLPEDPYDEEFLRETSVRFHGVVLCVRYCMCSFFFIEAWHWP